MPTLPPSIIPAPYVPFSAIAYALDDEETIAVGPGAPLPVGLVTLAASSTALSGTSSSTAVVGPFQPTLGRAIWLTLSGTWTGQVQVVRSTDGGTTKRKLTAGGYPWASFTDNANEPVAIETVDSATYYLDITLSSGTLAYEVAQ